MADDSTRLYGPQPDDTFHFRRMGVDNALYADILTLGGKLVEPAPAAGVRVPYFKLDYKTEIQQAAVDELVDRWRDNVAVAFPRRIDEDAGRYVSGALRRIGGSTLVDPAGHRIGTVFRDVRLETGKDGGVPLTSERRSELETTLATRFALARHIAGEQPDPALAAELGLRTMTDRNVIFVRKEIAREYGTYYDPAVKGTVFVPDASLDPATAADAYGKAEAVVRAARDVDPKEFDRLRVGLELTLEVGLGADVFPHDAVNSLDDLVALDYGRMEYQDALKRAQRAYRELIVNEPERALEIGGERAYSLNAAIAMTMGTRRDELGLESVINTGVEANRDASRAVNAAAYQASDGIRDIAAQLASNGRTMDGRVTEAERWAEQLQGLAETYDADVERYVVAKDTVTWGPIVARDGDLYAQLVEGGERPELVVHDRAALVDVEIRGRDAASASIGHRLTPEVIDKAIAERTPIVLAAYGEVTFALSAGKLGLADRYGTMRRDDAERTFGAAAVAERKSLDHAALRAIRDRASERRAAPVPPAYVLPAAPTAVDMAKAERHDDARERILAKNRQAAAATQESREAVVTTARARLESDGRSTSGLGVREPSSTPPINGEIVAVSPDRSAIVVNELRAKTHPDGSWVGLYKQPVLETPERPRLLVIDAREHVTPLYPHAFMTGTNKDGSARDATPLTIGGTQGALVVTKLLGQDRQYLIDMGHDWHANRPARQRPSETQTASVGSRDAAPSRLAAFGDAGKPASTDSDRESAIGKIEMTLRMRIAEEAGYNIYATQEKLLARNPGATLKDATTSLGITVQRVDAVRMPKGAGENEDQSWKQIQKDLARSPAGGAGLAFDDFYGGAASLRVVEAKATRISGTVAALDTEASVMYVHEAHGADDARKHRLHRIDFPPAQLGVRDAAHLDGTPRRQGVALGDTVSITYEAHAGHLEPKLELVNRELAREASFERAEAVRAGRAEDRSKNQALDAATLAQKDRLLAEIAARALEGTAYVVKAPARGVVPTDDRAKNQGFLFPIKANDHALVVQVAQHGPGSPVEGFRVFDDRDLYDRVAQRDAKGAQPAVGMYAEIVLGDDRKPTIVTAMTQSEFRRYEVDVASAELDRATARTPDHALDELASRRRA